MPAVRAGPDGAQPRCARRSRSTPVVDVAQLVELQVVALVAAGSSPVVHPRPSLLARAAGPDGVDGTSGRRRLALAATHTGANVVRVWRNW
jgi:hypothetical protein